MVSQRGVTARLFARFGDPAHVAAEVPPPESEHQKRQIHRFALLTLVVFAGYLCWRATMTIDWASWWIAVPLLIAEARVGVGLLLFTMALWDIDVRAPSRRVTDTDWRIAVLIPTYNEPIDVLLPTVAAAKGLQPVHETWVLDDGNRPEVRALAEALDVGYLARPTHEHAKAGNLNYALDRVNVDLVAVLDADHVAAPNFLTNTLGYFDDPNIAVVQTPQDFYNTDSFEHDRGDFMSQRIFYRAIAVGKNRWGAAFWAGTGALVRTEALRDVGGVATDSVTEDIMTTMRMHRRGWKSTYHNEVLARGLAASDAAGYLVQRNRWARGAMQMIRSEGPFRGPGLTFAQRVAYATTLSGWFDSWRTVNMLVLPLLVILTGIPPLSVSPVMFVPIFVTLTGLNFLCVSLLARGHFRFGLSLTFSIIDLPAVLTATLGVFGGRHSFRVTPKGRTKRGTPHVPAMLWVLLVATSVGACWCLARLVGLTSAPYGQPGSAVVALAFDAMNVGLILSAVRRIRSPRFSGERRAGFRFPLNFEATIRGVPCRITDVSMTGAALVVPQFGPAQRRFVQGERTVLAVQTQTGAESCLSATVVRATSGRTQRLGLVFEAGQYAAVSTLVPLAFSDGRNTCWDRPNERPLDADPAELGAAA